MKESEKKGQRNNC